VADTLGELGLLYRVAGIALVGGSLVPHGGQNPLEPARLGCALLHGPFMRNFAEIAEALAAAGASRTVQDAATLTDAVAALLADPTRRGEMAAAAAGVADAEAHVLDAVMEELAPFLKAAMAAYARA
jgi:3-deoxy-D-manno-octulosonic-acid transferase